jgi:hypothetical protein
MPKVSLVLGEGPYYITESAGFCHRITFCRNVNYLHKNIDPEMKIAKNFTAEICKAEILK